MAKYARKNEEDSYKLYIAETLRCISESTAKYGGGQFVTAKWANIADQKPQKEWKPGKIAADIIKGAGLVVVRKRR